MKDLFSGSLGKLDNHGGSRMFTTPNTVYVPPEYEVETDVPSIAEFVTCSLDGRLWIWKRSRRYYVAAFRWNEITQKLVFSGTTILNNINIIGRGIDWILTDTMIIQVLDDEPYVITANLFNDSETSFLYSILRSKVLSSGIDPITQSAWGLSEGNGNSEGYGYFNRSALLQSVNKHYSLLPAIGDWNIINNFLVRRPDNPLTDSHNSMLNIRPLIPLEFNGSKPAYGCGFDNDINLTCNNNELWGRGIYHFGKCYILPAVFAEDGTPQEFYLYISPDYRRRNIDTSIVTRDEWINMGILHTGETLYGFLTEKLNSLDNGLCYQSDTPKVFILASKEWLQLLEDGLMFIDTLNNSGLVLSDDTSIFLNDDNVSYECNGLKQWLDPASKVEAITEKSVISSWDNATLATYIQQGFHRELLNDKTLPFSAKSYSGKRLSFGNINIDNKNAIQVNSIKNDNEGDSIAWENIYKPAVEIKSTNFQTIIGNGNVYCLSFQGHKVPVFIVRESTEAMYRVWNSKDSFDSWIPTNLIRYRGYRIETTYGSPEVIVDDFYTEASHFERLYTIFSGAGGSYHGYFLFPAHSVHYNALGFYVIPETGDINYFSLNLSVSASVQSIEDETSRVYDNWDDENTTFYAIWSAAIDENGNLGVVYSKYSGGMDNRSGLGKSIENKFDLQKKIPTSVLNYQSISGKNLCLQNFQYPQYVSQNSACSAFAVFQELHSNTIFPYEIPSIYYEHNGEISGYQPDHDSDNDDDIYNFYDIDSYRDYGNSYTKGLHVKFLWKNNIRLSTMIFKSELYPDIFNFYSEVERSKLS